MTTPVGARPGDGLAMLYIAVIKQGESDLATSQVETIAEKNARDADLRAQEEAIAREEQAEESSGFWGDVGGVFDAVADVAVPAGVVLSAAAPPVGGALLAVGAVATAAGGGARVVGGVYQHAADEDAADATEAGHALDHAARATSEILEGIQAATEGRRSEEKTLAGVIRTRDEAVALTTTPEGRIS